MPLTVNTNVASLAAQRSMLTTNSALETSFERLATGKRINSAVDDAAGSAVAATLTTDINALNQAIRNVNDGISVTQIAEGAMGEIADLLQRMREVAVQANTSLLSATEQGYITSELTALAAAIDDVDAAAQFSGVDLGAAATLTIQSGTAGTDTTNIAVYASDSTTLSVTGLLGTAAPAAITAIDAAITTIATQRATIGATQGQLEATVRNLANIAENTTAARSRIEDTDYAAETANLTKNQILQQASTSILAQANQQPQNVLALLQ